MILGSDSSGIEGVVMVVDAVHSKIAAAAFDRGVASLLGK